MNKHVAAIGRWLLSALAFSGLSMLLLQWLLPNTYQHTIQLQLKISPLCTIHCFTPGRRLIDIYIDHLTGSPMATQAATSVNLTRTELLGETVMTCQIRFPHDPFQPFRFIADKAQGYGPAAWHPCASTPHRDLRLQISAYGRYPEEAEARTRAWVTTLQKWRADMNAQARPDDHLYVEETARSERDTKHDYVLAAGVLALVAWLALGGIFKRRRRNAE